MTAPDDDLLDLLRRIDPTAPVSAPLASAARAARVAAILERLDDPDARAHARGLRAFLTDAPLGVDLDLALGVSPAPGCRAWHEEARRMRRDDALRALAAIVEGSTARRAELIAERLERYAASTFRHDRRAGMPATTRETRRLEFAALVENGGQPPSARTIRRALGERIGVEADPG
ncbi:hypothetical protein [Salinarimonas rosea]|uniref:hypothetical protein n=1 Tax=Salinarimonas rosea TaxID=552063 RepID=UPI0004161273|nr:hypothetical protein [Salinarimonas rosea]